MLSVVPKGGVNVTVPDVVSVPPLLTTTQELHSGNALYEDCRNPAVVSPMMRNGWIPDDTVKVYVTPFVRFNVGFKLPPSNV